MKKNKILFIVNEINSANGICCSNVFNELIKNNKIDKIITTIVVVLFI